MENVSKQGRNLNNLMILTIIACFQRHKRGGGCQRQDEDDDIDESVDDELPEQSELVEGEDEIVIPEYTEDPMPVLDLIKLLTENPFE